MKKKVIAFVPLPPPPAGPEIATQAMLNVLSLPHDCELRVVKANVRTSNDRKGNFDREGIFRAGKSLLNLFFHCLCFRPQKAYLLVNPSKAGFLRDAAAIFIARLFFCKVIAHYHGSHFHYFYKTSSCWFRFLIRITLRQLHVMIVQAERLKNIFSGLLFESRLSVLYNGVSDACLERGKTAVALRKARKRDPVTFLFLGHISFAKGFYDLMSAYKKLIEQGKKIRLLIAGDFILNLKTQVEFLERPYRQFYVDHSLQIHHEILEFVQNRTISGIEYHGIVEGEQKYLLFEQADVFVLPSHTEGFPNVVLEAMAFGLGLIVTPVGALPEVLQEPDNAYFVEPGNSDSLVRQMNGLLAQPSICFEMGMKNRKLVEQKYQMQLTARKFSELVLNWRETRS
ncbi:MAG: hypothetical protein A2W61_04865 [Deltaproteobacteria bacterium RIFCSPLOWO2_01_44_7]|nr:MAG: hypothetical protein A2712_02890 [Deltaproteobacteria bacterium RIFCSPHIGHO2_01_FULL_43_49]OGQ16142.1 MAG: hypothetical protein A3D22_00860 [Deltaproteobacteria bacterium RIFCSPHIGHO2_02_FULL_44_53]OGQ29103.1 MAG: hypothetical protein A3D98_04645 [Deltaproteobacteria bacterium RIFCSPHIGHO2_12_FULL_44_21]OGQ32659.1 MAG: hypothetical protein A2979_08790 [Deltaproteobacteria bacterium RIFCSPLOWO2_01_FULL_45_74]OGQ37911.1 MAG: hypothetical protein A2W61_04865 [Deltaproteobacteria bacterium 